MMYKKPSPMMPFLFFPFYGRVDYHLAKTIQVPFLVLN